MLTALHDGYVELHSAETDLAGSEPASSANAACPFTGIGASLLMTEGGWSKHPAGC